MSKKSFFHRLVALCLCVCFLVGVCPMQAFAEEVSGLATNTDLPDGSVVVIVPSPSAEDFEDDNEDHVTEPTVEPTAEPAAEPTVEPTAEPVTESTVEPTAEPTVEATSEPTETFSVYIYFVDMSGKYLCNRYEKEVISGESFKLGNSYELPYVNGYTPVKLENETTGEHSYNIGEFRKFFTIDNVNREMKLFVYYDVVEATVEPTAEPTSEPTTEPDVDPNLEAQYGELYGVMLLAGAFEVSTDGVYAVVCDGVMIGKYAPGQTVTLSVPTKDGYDFNGWKAVCSESVTITENSFTMPSAPVGIVSQWKAQTNQIAIYYVTTSGTRLYDADFSTVLRGSSFDLAEAFTLPAIDGYTATSIKHNGTTYTDISDYKNIIKVDSVVSDEVFYVVYEPADTTYTVKYYLQNFDETYSATSDSFTKNGKFGEKVLASSNVKDYAGFTWNGEEDEITLTSNSETNLINIYYTRNTYKLNYQKENDTDTISVKYGETVDTTTLGTPVRAGYTFASWKYTDETAVPQSFEMPAHDVTLVAEWNPATVSYMVYYWQETLASANNVDEIEGYDFVESESFTATTGSFVNGTNTKSFTGFEFHHGDENVTVAADGSTIVNVYYARKWYNYYFYSRSNGGGGRPGGGSSSETLLETVTYKYGANLTTSPYEWPTLGDGYYWTKDSNPYGCPKLAIEAKDIKLYRAQGNTSITLYGWYEDGSYKALNTWTGNSSWGNWTSSQRYTPEGYTAYFYGTDNAIPENDGNGIAASTKGSLYGYHVSLKKNSYTLTLNNGESDIGSHTYLYEADISNALSDMGITTITPPAAYTGYEFDGWTWMHQPYSLEGKTMPASNMVLIASWKAPVYTVNFYDDDTMTNLIYFEEVERGKTVQNHPTNPEKENREFIGWFYMDDGIEKLYAEGKIINSSINVYAKWIMSDDIKAQVTIVHNYYEGDGTTLIKTEQDSEQGIVNKNLTVYARSENGFYPDVLSQNILVGENASENILTFNYTQMTDVQYTVHYVDGEGNKLIPDKVATTSQLIIVEEYVYIPSATPRILAQELRLTSNPANNVLTFVYDVEGTTSYTIMYWQEQLDGSYEEVEDDRIVVSDVRYYTQVAVTSEQMKSYEGFEYDASISNTSEWLMPDEVVVLNLYYKRNEFTVTYMYSSTIDDVTMPELPQTKTYKFGEEVTVADNNISIEGAPWYEFKGWYRQGDAVETAITSFEMPSNDVVLYGYFERVEYYITVEWTHEDGVYHGGTYSWNCKTLEYVQDTSKAGWSATPYVKCVVKNYGTKAVNLDFSANVDKWDDYFKSGTNPFNNLETVRLEGGATYTFEFRNDIELQWDYDKLNAEAADIAINGKDNTEETNSFGLDIFKAD